jgi:hypothetical protein
MREKNKQNAGFSLRKSVKIPIANASQPCNVWAALNLKRLSHVSKANETVTLSDTETGMARAVTKNMNYYEKLVSHIDKSMKAHPRSTIVMDTGSFKVIAKGKDFESVSRILHSTSAQRGVAVVFRKPTKNAVWIL